MLPLSHLALLLLVILIWGFNFVVIQTGLEQIPPILLVCVRFFLTSIPAVFFIKRPSAPFRMVALYGLVMFALQFSLLFIGMYAGVAPGVASLILQIQVFFTALLAALFLEEKLRTNQIIGALIAFSGIALVAINVKGQVKLAGVLLVLAAAVFWAVGNVIAKKIGRVNMISLVVWGSLVAWPPLLAVSLSLEGADQILTTLDHLTWLSGGAALYITYLATLFGFGAWNWLIHHQPLGVIAPFTLLVPIVAILSSVILMNEPLQTWKILAALLVLGGVSINLLKPRKI